MHPAARTTALALASVFALSTTMTEPVAAADIDNVTVTHSAANVPFCEEHRVLANIQKRFQKVHRKYRASDLQIQEISSVRETDVDVNPKDEFDRRFCVASATLSDGYQPNIYYLIVESYGLASIGWGVDYCVEGYDYERAYGAFCRSVRAPF